MKPFRKLSVSFSLSIENLNFINDKCKELGISSSDYIGTLIDEDREKIVAKLGQVSNKTIDLSKCIKF